MDVLKTFRISWHAVVEDESVLEGRSLVDSKSEEEAIFQLRKTKSREYRLKQEWIQIESIYETIIHNRYF